MRPRFLFTLATLACLMTTLHARTPIKSVKTDQPVVALTFDDGTGPAPVAVPKANLSVEETRGEAFVSHAWQIDPRWSLDSRLAAEISRLSFTGDTDQSVALTYVKPRVQLTRKFGKHQLQMRVFRDVGQLDFTDFVSTAQFADDVINGGNPDLRPQTAWAGEVARCNEDAQCGHDREEACVFASKRRTKTGDACLAAAGSAKQRTRCAALQGHTPFAEERMRKCLEAGGGSDCSPAYDWK